MQILPQEAAKHQAGLGPRVTHRQPLPTRPLPLVVAGPQYLLTQLAMSRGYSRQTIIHPLP